MFFSLARVSFVFFSPAEKCVECTSHTQKDSSWSSFLSFFPNGFAEKHVLSSVFVRLGGTYQLFRVCMRRNACKHIEKRRHASVRPIQLKRISGALYYSCLCGAAHTCAWHTWTVTVKTAVLCFVAGLQKEKASIKRQWIHRLSCWRWEWRI